MFAQLMDELYLVKYLAILTQLTSVTLSVRQTYTVLVCSVLHDRKVCSF